jgi:thiosulfate dehydrogenase (quinone) large subunit
MNRLRFSSLRLVLFIVIVAGFVLHQIVGNESGSLSTAEKWLVILSLILIVAGIATYVWDGTAAALRGTEEELVIVEDPPVARFLLADARSAPIWLVVRLYVGYQWLNAGSHKVTNDAWQDGSALRGYREKIVAPDSGITYGWYRDFIQVMLNHEWYTWFGPLVAWGETLVGVGLILGALTGPAAFFGAFMNFNFMLAGSASTNPVLFFQAILIMLAWKVAGFLGVDFYLLPRLGTWWSPGTLFQKPAPAPESGQPTPATRPS